jgi:hypothetical protein
MLEDIGTEKITLTVEMAVNRTKHIDDHCFGTCSQGYARPASSSGIRFKSVFTNRTACGKAKQEYNLEIATSTTKMAHISTEEKATL